MCTVSFNNAGCGRYDGISRLWHIFHEPRFLKKKLPDNSRVLHINKQFKSLNHDKKGLNKTTKYGESDRQLYMNQTNR